MSHSVPWLVILFQLVYLTANNSFKSFNQHSYCPTVWYDIYIYKLSPTCHFLQRLRCYHHYNHHIALSSTKSVNTKNCNNLKGSITQFLSSTLHYVMLNCITTSPSSALTQSWDLSLLLHQNHQLLNLYTTDTHF